MPACAVQGAMGKAWLDADPVLMVRIDSEVVMVSRRVPFVGEIDCPTARAAKPNRTQDRMAMLAAFDAGIVEEEQERTEREWEEVASVGCHIVCEYR